LFPTFHSSAVAGVQRKNHSWWDARAP